MGNFASGDKLVFDFDSNFGKWGTYGSNIPYDLTITIPGGWDYSSQTISGKGVITFTKN
jgi:carbohydrate-binding DOMON domain-containing protein